MIMVGCLDFSPENVLIETLSHIIIYHSFTALHILRKAKKQSEFQSNLYDLIAAAQSVKRPNVGPTYVLITVFSPPSVVLAVYSP